MAAENQHWVPKFLVKNFSSNDGRVYCLDVKTDLISKKPPKGVASDSGFYNFSRGGKTLSFEDRLADIENRAAPVVKKIIRDRSVGGLSNVERKSLSDFIATQSFRTQAFRQGLTHATTNEQQGEVFEQLWRSTFLLSEEILRRYWAVLTINHNDVFYLGDHPVVLQRTENPEKAGELGFDIKGVEAYLPLSPQVALYLPCRTTADDIISGFRTAIAAPLIAQLSQAGSVNRTPESERILEIATRVIKNSGELYQAFMTGVALDALPENVENLNYLQCAWSHTQIYSNRPDFSFAKKLFSRTPQHRDTIPVHLAEFRSRNF